MDDPTNAREFKTPTGEIMWISPAAADVAKESPMGRQTMVAGSDKTITEAPASGLYQIGRGVFRYKRGDKIPVGAVHLKDGVPAKGDISKIAKRTRKPSANQQGKGPEETS